MPDIENYSGQNTSSTLPTSSEWGPDMDSSAHIQGYKGFLRVLIVSSLVIVLVLIFMGFFLT